MTNNQCNAFCSCSCSCYFYSIRWVEYYPLNSLHLLLRLINLFLFTVTFLLRSLIGNSQRRSHHSTHFFPLLPYLSLISYNIKLGYFPVKLTEDHRIIWTNIYFIDLDTSHSSHLSICHFNGYPESFLITRIRKALRVALYERFDVGNSKSNLIFFGGGMS